MEEISVRYQEKYRKYVLDKIRRYTNQKWWGNVRYSTIGSWINQFPKDNKDSIVAYLLLDSIFILTNEHIEASAKSLVEKIRNDIFCDEFQINSGDLMYDDSYFEGLWNDHMRDSIFISAQKHGDTAGSAAQIARSFRNILDTQYREIDIDAICKDVLTRKPKNVYITCDFIGTGKQMDDFLNYEINCKSPMDNCKPTCCLIEIFNKYPKVNFNILAIAAHIDGLQNLKKNYTKLKILTANLLTSEYDLLSSKTRTNIDECYITDVGNAVNKIRERYNMHSNYSLNLPIGFEYGFPNNSLELFWWPKSENGWKSIIPRKDGAK
jgi:hypothetical protein